MSNLELAIKFRQDNCLKRSEVQFKKIEPNYLDDSFFYYQFGWLLDKKGNQKEAIEKYKKAINLGLSNEYLADCYLGLGSSYRVLKNYDKSIRALKKAIKLFPLNYELKLFLSLSYFDKNNFNKSYSTLLDVLLCVNSNEQIALYSKTINSYKNKLNR